MWTPGSSARSQEQLAATCIAPITRPAPAPAPQQPPQPLPRPRPTRRDALAALVQDRAREHGGAGGAVARHVVGGRRHLLDQAGAHVLKLVAQLDRPGHRYTILCDLGAAVRLLDHHVAALGAQRDLRSSGRGGAPWCGRRGRRRGGWLAGTLAGRAPGLEQLSAAQQQQQQQQALRTCTASASLLTPASTASRHSMPKRTSFTA
jgi:hypothetical protein